MESPLISVVIPIYNGANYIPATLDSVLASTYKQFEIICMEDFSTDNSKDILKEYAQRDSRVRLIEMPQKGGDASQGIIHAIPHCKGNYFFYLSQDDLISPDCLEKCVVTAIQEDAEVVLPNMIWYYEGKDNLTGIFPGKVAANCEITPEDAFEGSITYKYHGFSLRAMALIKREPFDGKYIDSCDTSGSRQYLKAKKISTCDGTFYYRQDNQHAINKGTKINEKTFSFIQSRIEILDYAIKNGCCKKTIRSIAKTLLRLFYNTYHKIAESNQIEQSHLDHLYLCKRQIQRYLLKVFMLRQYMKLIFLKNL